MREFVPGRIPQSQGLQAEMFLVMEPDEEGVEGPDALG